MKRIAALTLAAVMGAAAPASAQWSLSWGTAGAPACYDGGNGEMCVSALLNYNADGTAQLYFWNRMNYVGNSIGIVDNIAFSGLAAPTSTAFTLTRPSGATDANWAYGAPPLGGLGSWGWGVSGGGICDETSIPPTCGGNASKKFSTDWNGGFNMGGAAVFSFFLGNGIAAPTGAVTLWAHIRDAVPDGEGGWTSDRWMCVGSPSDCDEEDHPDPPQEIVPEPATMTLLATGLVGLAATRRRKGAQRSN